MMLATDLHLVTIQLSLLKQSLPDKHYSKWSKYILRLKPSGVQPMHYTIRFKNNAWIASDASMIE